jgi:hypothetical protein
MGKQCAEAQDDVALIEKYYRAEFLVESATIPQKRGESDSAHDS